VDPTLKKPGVDPSLKKPHIHYDGEFKKFGTANTGMHGTPSDLHSKLATLKKVGKAAGYLGPAAQVYSVGKETYQGYQKDGAAGAIAAGGKATAREIVGSAGAAYGALQGAALGAKVGFYLTAGNPLGAGVGTFVGGVIGGGIGYFVGSTVTEEGIDYGSKKVGEVLNR
jgi:hypothetical protein